MFLRRRNLVLKLRVQMGYQRVMCTCKKRNVLQIYDGFFIYTDFYRLIELVYNLLAQRFGESGNYDEALPSDLRNSLTREPNLILK